MRRKPGETRDDEDAHRRGRGREPPAVEREGRRARRTAHRGADHPERRATAAPRNRPDVLLRPLSGLADARAAGREGCHWVHSRPLEGDGRSRMARDSRSPKPYGGSDMGLMASSRSCSCECGRVLAPEPLLSTLLLGANAVRLSEKRSNAEGRAPRRSAKRRAHPDRLRPRGAPGASIALCGRDDGHVTNGDACRDHGKQALRARRSHGADQIVVVGPQRRAHPPTPTAFHCSSSTRTPVAVQIQRTEHGRRTQRGPRRVRRASHVDGARSAWLDAGTDLLERVLDQRHARPVRPRWWATSEEAFERTLAYLKEPRTVRRRRSAPSRRCVIARPRCSPSSSLRDRSCARCAFSAVDENPR